jgi:hypothetical protein
LRKKGTPFRFAGPPSSRQGADIEPEKITNELEAPVSGVVSKILVAAGTEEIEVGSLLYLIE